MTSNDRNKNEDTDLREGEEEESVNVISEEEKNNEFDGLSEKEERQLWRKLYVDKMVINGTAL